MNYKTYTIHACVAVQEKVLNCLAFARSIHELCTSISIISEAHYLGCEVLTYVIRLNSR